MLFAQITAVLKRLTSSKQTNIIPRRVKTALQRRRLMLNLTKQFFKNAKDFLKPRIVLCSVMCLAFASSTLFFLGQINTFVISFKQESVVVRSLSAEIGNAIACAGYNTEEYKVVSADKTSDGTAISLARVYPVFVTAGDKTVSATACENDTVAMVLNCAGFTVDEYDMVEPALNTVITDETYIDYVNVDYISGSYTQNIPYSIETVYSDKLEVGKNTTTEGSDGLEQINYTQKIVNGEITETTVDSKVLLLAAKNAVKTVGTRPVAVTTSASVSCISQLSPSNPIDLDKNGNPVSYKKHITVQATAYTYTGKNCATGVAPKPGYIAVNPKVIPYGTKMYIKSSDGKYVYGYAVAADTGGFIASRPTNVDLFFPTVSSMNTFGRRNVEIYILN